MTRTLAAATHPSYPCRRPSQESQAYRDGLDTSLECAAQRSIEFHSVSESPRGGSIRREREGRLQQGISKQVPARLRLGRRPRDCQFARLHPLLGLLRSRKSLPPFELQAPTNFGLCSRP